MTIRWGIGGKSVGLSNVELVGENWDYPLGNRAGNSKGERAQRSGFENSGHVFDKTQKIKITRLCV